LKKIKVAKIKSLSDLLVWKTMIETENLSPEKNEKRITTSLRVIISKKTLSLWHSANFFLVKEIIILPRLFQQNRGFFYEKIYSRQHMLGGRNVG